MLDYPDTSILVYGMSSVLVGRVLETKQQVDPKHGVGGRGGVCPVTGIAKELQGVKLSFFGVSCPGLYYSHTGLPTNY